MVRDSDIRPGAEHPTSESVDDVGGLHAPPDLRGAQKVWWWFHFLVLVNLRLRFIGILVVIGLIIMKWDTLNAYYDRWTRPTNPAEAQGSDVEYFCPMHPSVVRDNPREKCPICFMPLSKRKKGSGVAEVLPAGVVSRVQLSPYRIVLAGIQTWPVDYRTINKRSHSRWLRGIQRARPTNCFGTSGRSDRQTCGQRNRADG